MSPARVALALALSVSLLVGCGSGEDPAGERREVVATLTEAANAGDAGGVRRHAERLVELVEEQLAGEQVDAGEAERLIALAASVREGADAIDEDLQARLKAEADAEAARKELEATQARLEQERRAAEEAAEKDGKGKGDKDEDEEKGDKDD